MFFISPLLKVLACIVFQAIKNRSFQQHIVNFAYCPIVLILIKGIGTCIKPILSCDTLFKSTRSVYSTKLFCKILYIITNITTIVWQKRAMRIIISYYVWICVCMILIKFCAFNSNFQISKHKNAHVQCVGKLRASFPARNRFRFHTFNKLLYRN